MKLRHILPAMALAMPLVMSARPAKPGVQTVYNPDGLAIEVMVHGDEFFSYTTDASGSMILERDGQGYWRQAMLDGVKLTASVGDVQKLRDRYGIAGEHSVILQPENRMRMAALDSEGRTTYPTTGDVHGLVVLMEFDDVRFRVPDIRNQIDKMVNQEGYSDYGSRGSARDYYIATSYGQFKPIFDVAPVVTLPYSLKYVVGLKDDGTPESWPGAGHTGRFGEAIQYAIKELDKNGWDFSKYDYDNNGEIDNIFFFYAGYGQADQPKNKVDDNGKLIYDANGKTIPETLTIWPHQYYYAMYTFSPYMSCSNLVVDGKTVNAYACSNELIGALPQGAQHPYLDGVGAFCHEFGHVLGLPDLYDTSSYKKTKTPGYYDLMCSGSYNENSTCPPLFSAYERWVLRWLDPTQVENGNTYVLKPTSKANQGVRIRVPLRSGALSPTEYYFVENRKKEGWDKSLPEEGMYVWHIRYDKNAWLSNSVNCDGVPRVEMMEASAKQFAWPGDRNITYTYPGATNALNPVTPNMMPGFGIYLTEMQMDKNGNGVFEYNVLTAQPETVTVMNDKPTRSINGRSVWLSWDHIPGVKEVLLTVKRTDANGNTYIYEGLNERSIVGLDGVLLRNISSAVWDQEFQAYVRVIDKIPSSKISNIVTFVPSQLEQSGVENVETDKVPVYGGKGFISAPEGSEVYTLDGRRTVLDNLTPGIYLVRCGARTHKVMVR